jgi:hypothetical protein
MLQSWRWRQNVLPKRRNPSTKLHTVTIQKTRALTIYFKVLSCTRIWSDNIRLLDLVIGFIEHLQIVTTSNYSAVANSNTLQLTTHFSVCCVFTSRLSGDRFQQRPLLPSSRSNRLATVPQLTHCSSCPAHNISARIAQKTPSFCCCIQLLRAQPSARTAQINLSSVAIYGSLPSNGRCLIVSQSLPSNRSTCRSMYQCFKLQITDGVCFRCWCYGETFPVWVCTVLLQRNCVINIITPRTVNCYGLTYQSLPSSAEFYQLLETVWVRSSRNPAYYMPSKIITTFPHSACFIPDVT